MPMYVLPVVGTVQVIAFLWILARYTSGAGGSLDPGAGSWQPPLGGWTLVVGFTAVVAAGVSAGLLVARRSVEEAAS